MMSHFFIISNSCFINHFVVCNCLLIPQEAGNEERGKILIVELFVVIFLELKKTQQNSQSFYI